MKLKADAGYGYKALARNTIHRKCSVTDRPFDSVAIDVRSRLFRYIRLTCTKRTTWRKIRCVFGILVDGKDPETERVLQDALATMKAEVGMLSVSNAIYVLCSPTRCPFRARTLIAERDAHKTRACDRFNECVQHCKKNPLNVRKILECHKAFETYLITHIEPLCLAYNDTQNQSLYGAESVLSTANHSFESDRLCAVLEVDAVLSEDFDCVALFGARVMIVSVDYDTASYVALSDVLRTFLCNSRDELVNKCCLMGTDYNLGMKGIGPATIQKIDKLLAYNLANQCMSLQAIDIDRIKHFFRIA